MPDMEVPGDRCYVFYKELMKMWKENPRWTTIDKMAEYFIKDPQLRAAFLAFLVFFAIHGMDYEQIKRKENGDIL